MSGHGLTWQLSSSLQPAHDLEDCRTCVHDKTGRTCEEVAELQQIPVRL